MQFNKLVWPAVAVTFGIALGISVFTIHYAKGFSYLSNDSEACANCHIMREHFNAWGHSSHKNVAQCNDCHAPKDLIGKYMTKATNGFEHSLAFTTGNFPDPISIKPKNLDVAEASCRSCHDISIHKTLQQGGVEGASCTRCHAGVGHMTR